MYLDVRNIMVWNKKIFVYDFPVSIVDSWPQKYSHHRLSVEERFRSHFGAGELIDETNAFYSTHQYSLFTIFLERLRVSKYLTTSVEEADYFFIPYDIGMDSSTRESDGALFQTNCPRLNNVTQLLKESVHFKKSNGNNHFLLHSINQMMIYYTNSNCQRLFELCFNCTKLSIDTYPPGIYPFLDDHTSMTHKWLSIPFPSNYHYNGKCINPPWLVNTTISQSDWFSTYSQQRPYSVCFMGSTKVTAKKQRQLRRKIIAHCNGLSKTLSALSCLVIQLASHDSSTDILTISLPNSKKTINPYSMCRFCLMPGGDFPTRKGFLDAMLAGCIPVTFQLIAAQYQWPHHWGSLQTALDCSEYIPMEDMRRNTNHHLRALIDISVNATYLEKKLKCISNVGFRMQYSLPLVQRRYPFNNELDAFDIAIEFILKG